MHKRISLLGSTGSIGRSTLKVIRHLKGEVEVAALAARSNIDLLEKQILEFQPKLVAVFEPDKARELQHRFPHLEVLAGMEGLEQAAAYAEADLVISGISGAIALKPTIAAIRAGKTVGLANKEVLVAAGELVMSLAEKHQSLLIPLDSEHNAIFQCMRGEAPAEVRRLILTASGGPFRKHTPEQLRTVTAEQALRHPTWNMGGKITIDSSTLMNKGLEVIEASWLFSLPVEKIDVVIHPQSVVHSMVEFIDGSLIAHLARPDMVLPIQYAITHPERKEGMMPPFDFLEYGMLEFYLPDRKKFLCLDLAYRALYAGKSSPCFLNAANEVLVGRLLRREIGWIEIGEKLASLLERHNPIPLGCVEEVLAVDREARELAKLI